MKSKLDHGKTKSLMSPGGRKSQNGKLEEFRAATYHVVGSGRSMKKGSRDGDKSCQWTPFCPDVRPGR